MVVITERFTVGEVAFIIRVAIQVLFYGGLSLLILVILGHAPRISTVETHDVLNRIVGSSTVTISSLRWVVSRVVHGRRDPGPSWFLVLAVTLSILFGLFVPLTDIGLIGLSTCHIVGESFRDYPASVKSPEEALAIIMTNMANGADPNSVNSYRCDSAQDAIFVVDSSNITMRECTAWRNSTYGDPTDFRRLNTTDSDVLMPKLLARLAKPQSNGFDLNTYFLGGTGQIVSQAVLERGLAVIPQDTGVQLIVGVPQLSRQQRVVIPKTLALEVEMGCMEMGLTGQQDTADNITSRDFFTPDGMYNPTTRNYTGPDYLQQSLVKAAGAVRYLMRPWFNMSDPNSSGELKSFNESHWQGRFTWPMEAAPWIPPASLNISYPLFDILDNCTQEIQQSLNVSVAAASLRQPAQACGFYTLSGSFFESQRALQGHVEMVCATATQLNMVSASVEVGVDGQITASLTRLPSDLHRVEADYFNLVPGHIINYDPIQRFTLSDSSDGQLQHFIYQMEVFGATANILEDGPGSMGQMLSTVGSAMVGVDYFDSLLPVIDHRYFSLDGPGSAHVTKWGGGVGASYILGSTGYNAWAALGADPVTVVSTGGKPAACYNYRYAAAFVPLALTAFLILIWAIVLSIASRIRGAMVLRELYGGMAPVIVTPQPGRPPTESVLVWKKIPEPHLALVLEDELIVGNAAETLVSHMEDASDWSDMEMHEK